MSDSEPATHTIGVVATRAAMASASAGVVPTSTRPTDAGTIARSVSTAVARGLDDATRTIRSAIGASAPMIPAASLSRRIPTTNVTRRSPKVSRSDAASARAPAGL